MKAILKSIRPKHTANILDGNKTIEISTTAPKEWKDYLSGKTSKKPEPTDVYIYCTKDKKQLVDCPQWVENELCHQLWYDKNIALLEGSQALLNGKVVAKFTLNKVEKFYNLDNIMLGMACLNQKQIHEYMHGKECAYAWHIDNLIIFDKPKELSEFFGLPKKVNTFEGYEMVCVSLNRPPQSWQYIEVE